MARHSSGSRRLTAASGRVRSLAVLITALTTLVLVAAFMFLNLGDSNDENEDLAGEGPVRYVKFPDIPNAYLFDKSEDRSWMHPLNEVEWRTADQANHMKPEDPVLGLYLKNKAWAVSWWIMSHHHVANLVLDGQPILICICEVCSSGAAYRPVLEGKRYTFRVVGLYNGSNLISDYETGTFRTPFSGEALHGPLKGSRMEHVPLYQCTWAEWLTLHPASLVAYREDETRGGHGLHFKHGKRTLATGFKNTLLRPLDPRLPHNQLVLGVEVNGHARAYPLATLDKMGSVVNDALGDQEIVVLHLPETLLAMAFSRRLGREVLVFETGKDGRIVDQKYQATWNYAGEAVDGPLAGQKLSSVHSLVGNGISGRRITHRLTSSALTPSFPRVIIWSGEVRNNTYGNYGD